MIDMLNYSEFIRWYGGIKLKKLLPILGVLVIVILSFSIAFASGDEPQAISENDSKIEISGEMGNASSTTINNLTSKDKSIEEYTKALNGDRTNGTVLYYLVMARKYSYPVIFILMVINQ